MKKRGLLLFATLSVIAVAGISGTAKAEKRTADRVMVAENESSVVKKSTPATKKSGSKTPVKNTTKSKSNNITDTESTVSIFETMAVEAPEYYAKLKNNMYNGFVVVDKETMRVIYYDRNGYQQKAYTMACARNYGAKHKSGDNRTPEGFFTVAGIFNSTDWLYTDEKGVTSPTKGVYGPRFIRLKTPVTSSVGIHGTVSPGSLGKRVSHGCIRIANKNVLELVQYVEKGMPVIVLPSQRDVQVNKKEGRKVATFSTKPKPQKVTPEPVVEPAPVVEPEPIPTIEPEPERTLEPESEPQIENPDIF